MKAPLFLLMLSVAGLALTFVNADFADWQLVAGACVLASALLLLLGALRALRRKEVILDGSNVMYWNNGTPDLRSVQAVVDMVAARGLRAGVMFDANAGYLLSNSYRDDAWFAQALGLPQNRVAVMPKGTPADPVILTAARDRNARIITDDRFRDWVVDFPEVRQKGHLIRGGFRNGTLWLDPTS
ncbi:hypothetical protein [Jannaschia sp. 2305UL9-9]|uniref:NYN domain-containing protein n=1 Tax=Jannaschia sp. 2305UL9-9 TaxID=3121638 RepID=UPI003527AD0A